MRYLLLAWGDEQAEAALAREERMAIVEQHLAFQRMLTEGGHLVASGPLTAGDTTRVVRAHGGRTFVSDGPFAETKEQVGGFYLLECADLDEAVALARRSPFGPGGAVEIRPVADV
jgi:hypothetical protein